MHLVDLARLIPLARLRGRVPFEDGPVEQYLELPPGLLTRALAQPAIVSDRTGTRIADYLSPFMVEGRLASEFIDVAELPLDDASPRARGDASPFAGVNASPRSSGDASDDEEEEVEDGDVNAACLLVLCPSCLTQYRVGAVKETVLVETGIAGEGGTRLALAYVRASEVACPSYRSRHCQEPPQPWTPRLVRVHPSMAELDQLEQAIRSSR